MDKDGLVERLVPIGFELEGRDRLVNRKRHPAYTDVVVIEEGDTAKHYRNYPGKNSRDPAHVGTEDVLGFLVASYKPN